MHKFPVDGEPPGYEYANVENFVGVPGTVSNALLTYLQAMQTIKEEKIQAAKDIELDLAMHKFPVDGEPPGYEYAECLVGGHIPPCRKCRNCGAWIRPEQDGQPCKPSISLDLEDYQ